MVADAGGSSEGERTPENHLAGGGKFAADDGWAIASYIGLTLLTSLFPFLISLRAVAGFSAPAIWRTRRRSSFR
jgi:hypothetical protein